MTLRERLMESRILVAPGVFNAWSALLAERAGFEAVYLSGASIAYTRLGRPDIGLVSMSEVADVLATIAGRIALPVIVDADTGYGNALNVMRTVREFERAGGGADPGRGMAIQLEDQALPKRCGHLEGKSLVSRAEMVGKIRAALDARSSAETLILARTDAVAVEGLAAALERAEAYREAGADALFVEGLRSLQELKEAAARLALRSALLANMVEGGKTPIVPAGELERLGFRIVIFPGGLVRLLTRAASGYFADLKQAGTTEALRGQMLDLGELNALLGTARMLELGRRYDVAETKDN